MEKRTFSLGILWFFFKPYKQKVLLLGVLSLIVGLLEAASVAVVYPIISAALGEGTGGGTGILSFFQRVANLLPVSDEFIAYCLLFIIFAFVTFILKILTIRYRLTLAGRLVERNQKEIFGKFVQADYQFFVEHKQGELIYSAVTAPGYLQILLYSSTELFSQVVLSISLIILLFSLSWQGTIAVILMGLIYYFFTRYLADRVVYDAGKQQVKALTESTVILSETIGGIKQVKVFSTGADWVRRFGDTVRTHWYHYVRRFTWQHSLSPALMLILYLFTGIIAMMIRIIAPDSFGVLIPIFGTFAFAVFRLTPIIGNATDALMQIMGSLPNCERVYQILGDKLTHIEDGDKELDSFKSRIKFDKVTFTYKGRARVLEDVSITFEKGKTTAIVGRSGSGKTTIVNLLLRLYEVDRGEVMIDGVNIKQYKSASWLAKIGYVSQDTFIFNDTIKNNITFGSKYPDEEVVQVSKSVNAHSFVTELPDEYDTLVGDRAIKLSGGQRQRIAIARAMIRNPEILIFDEATNALDNISEASIQKAIDEISKDHTVIIIAHRLSTIVKADKIVMLGDGRVLEEGTHEELMRNGGAYSELYQSQQV